MFCAYQLSPDFTPENHGDYFTATYTLPNGFASTLTGLSYFYMGVIANTDRDGTFTLDNIRVTGVPEPASCAITMSALSVLTLRRRDRAA